MKSICRAACIAGIAATLFACGQNMHASDAAHDGDAVSTGADTNGDATGLDSNGIDVVSIDGADGNGFDALDAPGGDTLSGDSNVDALPPMDVCHIFSRTCASMGADFCGPLADGCGQFIDCGGCAAPAVCGGAGRPSHCGVPPVLCTPRTCSPTGPNCGVTGDGCGGMIDCGPCPTGQACGAGGTASVCAPMATTDGGVFCPVRTCAMANANCGLISNNCGGLLNCGSCMAPMVCGGAGTANQCGMPACVPRTCSAVGANCGPVADGCGGLIDCGPCAAGQTCGGGGTASQCGVPMSVDGGTCVPRTCSMLGANCGPANDGCGGLTANCGACTAPAFCGGGGPNRCGNPMPCSPRTCAAGACGSISDGCGGLLTCPGCTSPQTCGGGGVPNQCGAPPACVRRTTCPVGMNCGSIADGCGGLLSCGMCASGMSCGLGGPNVCGNPNTCTPRTCAQAGANCGQVADGCGGLTASCGACTAPAICGGGGVPSQCGNGSSGNPNCTNLCLRQVTCAGAATTTISGTVFAPGHVDRATWGNPDPLYNAVVYVPNAPVAPFTTGVACYQCGAPASGSPLVTATTGPDGTFTIRNVPTGANIPLVIQLGRWRRQVVIPNVNPCVDNPIPAELTRLPRNQTEGDIPLMAMVSGDVDSLECVLRKIGLDDSEFTVPTASGGTGRVQFYVANGSNADGLPAGSTTPAENVLWSSPATLDRYDMVLFACEGGQNNEMMPNQQNIIDYSNLGGRVFATHFSYVWLYNDAPFSSTATWNINQGNPPNPVTATVDQTFQRGMDFASWLLNVGASRIRGQVSIQQGRHDFDAVVAPSQRWLYTAGRGGQPLHYTFNTPVGAAPAAQCGRVLFSDFHVANSATNNGTTFPAECAAAPLTAQEKVLEFMLFDLASCIMPTMPPPPTCTPQTCMSAGATCGLIGDGCGGMNNCGSCPAGQTCGGGGMPSRCGSGACTPRTCATVGPACGPMSDNCGGMINCTCPAGQNCGGGGAPGVCGACMPRSCAAAGATCGPIADGCGGTIASCGMCTAPDSCGGGGTPSVCGHRSCVPVTCAAGSCGTVSDGCGGTLNCGTCAAPDTCGGGGMPNVCGHVPCTPRACPAGACGPMGDGCGGMLSCPNCMSPDTCGGGGTPSVCGHPTCVPTTCAAQGATCGPIGDGCGSAVNCGSCPTGQTCGGTPNHCISGPCTPQSCMSAGANCGPIADGCGQLLQCGTCTPPDTCGGGGMPFQCGHPTCTPTTCAAQGANCGPVGDGCGGVLQCGTCTAPDTCGGGGRASVCGSLG